ncbi:MAG: Gmad2 immunoglobulin-like domain-containing protein [Rhodothermales bacterium]|nr:Gmad2 immunoglobulin-like domain-containing protein [Rhodothermales bacterium]MBO6779190.1 Gmad2 immunoglobulin-like domain-containing protein [Rhodothermales bacterium]
MPCPPLDAAHVIVTEPRAGQQVRSPMEVRGCSRTFESNVQLRLMARDGSQLAAGFAMGGGVDGAGPFRFDVEFVVRESQLGHLEVYEEDVSDGEGFPPSRTVLPLRLMAD